MKIYLVFGVEYHVGETLLGVYESLSLANKRMQKYIDKPFCYDKVEVKVVLLNSDISDD